MQVLQSLWPVLYMLIVLITCWQVLSFWRNLYVNMSWNKKQKQKKSFSSDWAENLVESDKGCYFSLLRPGAMAEGLEQSAKHQMWPLGFHINIQGKPVDQLKNLSQIWKVKTLKHGKSSMATI